MSLAFHAQSGPGLQPLDPASHTIPTCHQEVSGSSRSRTPPLGRTEEALGVSEGSLLRRVGEEVDRMYADVPAAMLLKETELKSEERKLANFIEFIGEGRGNPRTRAGAADGADAP